MTRYSCAAMALLICLMSMPVCGQPEGALLMIGDRPPQLDFRTYKSHQTLHWSDLKNHVVVLEFWATWCQPCIENVPKINELVQRYSERPVSFISITYETDDMVETFLKKHPMHTTIGLDNDFAMFRSYKAWGIPMTVVVNASGKIACVIHPNKLNETVLDEVLANRIPRVEPARPWSDPKGAEEYFRSLVRKAEHSQ